MEPTTDLPIGTKSALRMSGTKTENRVPATVQPEQVGVPILVAGRDCHEVSLTRTQERQHLDRAPQDHATHGMGRSAGASGRGRQRLARVLPQQAAESFGAG